MEEQALPQQSHPGVHDAREMFAYGPGEGELREPVDGDDHRMSEGEPDEDPGEFDPVASALLLQRGVLTFSRQTAGITRDQFEVIRRRTAARRAEMAREHRTKAQNEAARSARPEATTNARPRTPRTRRPSTRLNAPAASPLPPPEPEPALAVPPIASALVTAVPCALRHTRSARTVSEKPLDPRLRPFAHALADLLVVDLLNYPPEKS